VFYEDNVILIHIFVNSCILWRCIKSCIMWRHVLCEDIYYVNSCICGIIYYV